jgi:hypothetical protein
MYEVHLEIGLVACGAVSDRGDKKKYFSSHKNCISPLSETAPQAMEIVFK